ncbi:MAG TPA: hypothetical protein VFM96_05045 [Gaiellaceae bacterium]|nr:hypothetical protein [Gaiellaceae bacterium]
MRRSLDLNRDLTTLFVIAVATVLLTRSFLALAGYPQVGGSKFHIAHVLYGGLLLLAACIVLLALLNPAVNVVAAVLGGIGFGLFIDEVGKFVTKNVNYFYRPAIAIIYVCFVLLFGVIRWLSRRRFSAAEALLIAAETLKQDAVGNLTAERRTRVLALLSETGAHGPLADGIRDLLDRAQVAPASPDLIDHARSFWSRLTSHRLFRTLIFALLAAGVAISSAELGWLLRHGVSGLTFSQKAFAASTLAADALLAIGALRLKMSLLTALHWYEHAVLLEITVSQVFLYTSEQLAASLNLAALLIVWLLLRWGIHFESNVRTTPAH